MALPTEVACGASSLADLAGIDPHGMARFAHRQRDHGIALQGREVHGFAGGLVDRLQIGLRAARQIDLQAGMAEIEDARAQRIKPPPRHLGGEAALDQRRQQMVAGGNVEAGAGGELGQRGLAAGLGDGFQQEQRTVDRLNAVAVAVGARARRTSLNPGSGQDGCVHWLVSPWAPREIGRGPRVKAFSVSGNVILACENSKKIARMAGGLFERALGQRLRLGEA